MIGAIAGLYAKVYYSGYENGEASMKKEWDAANALARKIADKIEAKDIARKEKADASHAKTRRDMDGLYAAYRSLRDSATKRSLLPEAAPSAASPATAAFDRSGLDNALSGFDRGITGLLEEGDRAIVDLNAARRWAQER